MVARVDRYLRQTASVVTVRTGQLVPGAAAALVLRAGALRHGVAARRVRHAHVPLAAPEVSGGARPVPAARVPAVRRLVAAVGAVRAAVAQPRQRDALRAAAARVLRRPARLRRRLLEPRDARLGRTCKRRRRRPLAARTSSPCYDSRSGSVPCGSASAGQSASSLPSGQSV